ncbi:hypothetical protein ACRYCC_39965 [Actinomadura scrupuli]|uniref:hypothetical protein n=1 Tax=Actinomadura scrupuli TaxID=559629 RepID=UPI003D98DE6E
MAPRHTIFREVMEGTIRLAGESLERPMRLELAADLPRVLTPRGDTEGPLTGRVRVPGFADDPEGTGLLRVAPIAGRQIRYRLDFGAADGRRLHLDGWKSVSYRRPVRSMTLLPATVTDADGTVVGEATLRFHVRRDLARFLASFRFPAPSGEPPAPAREPSGSSGEFSDPSGGRGELPHLRSRWRGQAGRLEVWYTTITDPATGTGVWLHHELVAPAGGGPARALGWAAVFPPGGPPVFGRFGPDDRRPGPGFAAGDVEVTGDRLTGAAGGLTWDLRRTGGGPTLYTFPRWAWERELLPAAQIVNAPAARFDGTVRFGDRVLELAGAPGGSARIYGHGNARRWAWLHADLGDGDVCEVVAAVSTRPGLDRLPPLPFVRLRVGGAEWPSGDPLLAALRMRADVRLPTWTVRGRIGDRRLRIEVTQRPEETVSVDYADPDGAPAVCHNSERSDAVITLQRRTGGHWAVEREWRLAGTAHAEVGFR